MSKNTEKVFAKTIDVAEFNIEATIFQDASAFVQVWAGSRMLYFCNFKCLADLLTRSFVDAPKALADALAGFLPEFIEEATTEYLIAEGM